MIADNITPIVIVLAAVLAVAVAIVIYLFLRLRRLESDYQFLTKGGRGQNFVEIVNQNIAQTDRLLEQVDMLSDRYAFVLRRMAGAVQHVGVVRYDAFRDLGGLLSFSIAFLDDRGNGLVISSIYGRSESRTYAKPIVERASTYELSPEEREAIRLALQSKELGALPVEARDREHEEKIANLKLFHDREYLERAKAEGFDRPVQRVEREGPKGREARRAREPAPEELEPARSEERSARRPAPEDRVFDREVDTEPEEREAAPRRSPARKAPRQPERKTPEPKRARPLSESKGGRPESKRPAAPSETREPRERTVQKKKPGRSRSLDTPVDRLRDRENTPGTRKSKEE